MKSALFYILIALSLASCSLSERISNIGKAPKLTKMAVYENEAPRCPDKNNILCDNNSFPELKSQEEKKYSNSIWPSTQNSLFGKKIGDIVSVKISVSDKAKLDNKTQKSRSGKTNMGVPSLFGLESKINKMITSKENASDSLVGINSNNTSKGSGKIDRSEKIQTVVAATVVSVLPSGNLIIKGSQEIRVNYEAREISIEGIINPMDIDSKGIIKLEKVAEARISYGGRGHISEYQQDPYGKQLVDIISPF